MGKIHKITKNGQTIYPATTTDAVAHPTLKVPVSKLIGEINVSNLFPTGGTNGTNKYTLESAIAKIPTDLRIVGIKCSFLSDAGTVEEWVYQGGTFTSTNSWMQGGSGSGGNMILEWNTDVANTRKQVPLSKRKKGLQISYKKDGTDWINEQFIGLNASIEAYWIQDAYWQTIALKKDVDTVDTKFKTFFGRILEWSTDETTTKLQVPLTERVNGLIIAFNNPDKGWINEQYTGSYTYDSEWQEDKNWQRQINYINTNNKQSFIASKNLLSNVKWTNGYKLNGDY